MEIKLSNFRGEAKLFGRDCTVEFVDGKLAIEAQSKLLTGEDAADIIDQLQNLQVAAPATGKPATTAPPKLASVPAAAPKPAAAAPAAAKPATAAPAAKPAAAPANGTNGAARPAAGAKPAAAPAAKPAVAAPKPAVAAAPKPAARPAPPPPAEVVEETVGEEEAPVEAAGEEAPAEEAGPVEVGELTEVQLEELKAIAGVRDVVRRMHDMGFQTRDELIMLCERHKQDIGALERVLDISERVERVLTVIQMSE